MIRKSNESVVDSRVVELTLDNSTFEKNATESISTISKLKKALDFHDAGKGLDEIDRGIKSININVLTEGVRSLRDEFNALDVIGVRTISRLTDKVENAAEAFLKGFTIDPVSDGWTKYAEKTTAVQTIMASTASAFNDVGEQTEYVYKQLDKLNWFTDETSYSFTDMVGNIGKFTSNSVDLDVAVTAMQGIANWAAISGQNASEASRAMYNLSQAISLGYVQLIDWKSIQNANMATTEFKQTALDTAVSLNMLKKTADNTYQTLAGHSVSVENFTSALTDKWFTTDVLLKTLDAYGGFTDKLYALQQKTGIYTSELLGYLEEYSTNVDVINEVAKETDVSAEELRKDFDELSSATYDLGKRSFRAGQEAKTFAEALEATKEAAGTAWSELFETMFGDYEHAKKLWTDLSETLFTIFVEPVQTLNDQLELAMGATDNAIDRSKWSELERSGLANPEFMKAVMLNAKQHGIAVEEFISDESNLDRSLLKTLDFGIESTNGINAAFQKFTGSTSDGLSTTIANMEAFRGSMLSALDEDAFYRALDSGVITVELINDTIDQLTGTTEANADSVNQSLESIRNEAIRVLRSQESGYDTNLKRRFEQLTENGFDAQAVQDYVNIWHELTNGTWDMSEATMAAVDAKWLETHAIEAQGEALNNIAGMSKEDMEKAREAAKQMAGQMALGLTGAALWRAGLGNLMETAVYVADAIKDAFMDVFFPPDDNGSDDWFSKVKNGLKTLGGVPLELYNIIKAFHDFTDWLKTSAKDSEELRAVFRGVFSVVDLLVQGFFTIRKMKLAAVFGFFEGLGLPLQDLVVKIGNLIFGIHNWVTQSRILNRVIEYTAGIAWGLGTAIRLVFDTLTSFPLVERSIRRFKIGFSAFGESIMPLIDGTKEKFVDFYSKVKEMGGINPSNLGEILSMFKTDIVDYIANFDGFKKLTRAFELTGDDIHRSMDKFVRTKMKPWLDTLGPTIVKALPKILSTIATGISNGWNVITGVISGLISGLTTAIFNIFGVDLSFLQTIFEGIAVGVKAVVTVVGGALITAFAALIKIVSTVIGVLKGAWTTIKDFFKVFTKSGSGGAGGGGGSPYGAISALDKFKAKFVSIIEKVKKVIAIGDRLVKLFFNRLSSFDTISFDAIMESFNFVKEALFDYLTHKFPGFARFRYEFDALIKKIKDGLANMGLDSEGIKSKWNKFSTFAGNAFERIYKGAKDLGSNVVKTVSDFLANPIVKKNIENFKSAFADAWGNLGNFFSGLWDTVVNWWNGIAEGGTLDFNNIGDWITSLIEAIKGYFSNFHGFDSIKNAFSTAWNDIITVLDEKGVLDKLNRFKEDINKALKDFSLGDVFNAFLKLFTESNEDMEDSEEKTITTADNIRKVVEDFVSGMTDLLSHFDMGDEFQDFIGLFTSTVDEVDKAAEDTDDTGNFFVKVVSTFISDLNAALKDFPTETLEGVVKTIAELFTALGFYNAGKGINRFSKVLKGESRGDLLKGLTGLIWSITGLVGSIALATAVLDPDTFQSNLEAVKACIEAISVFVSGASVIIEKFGTGLPGGNSYQMKNGWAFLDDIVGKLLDKGLLIALVAVSGNVLKELLSLENFDGEQALKAAEAISLMGGVFTAIGESIGIIGKIGVGPAEALRGMEAIATILGVGAAAGVGLGFICQAIATLYDQVWGDGSTAEYLQNLLDTGFDLIGNVVEKFGEVVGKFLGGIFSGAAKAATSGIDVVAENMVKFVEAVRPLGDGEHELNTSAIQSVLRQVEKISKSGFKIGFRNWLIGDDTIGEVTTGMQKIADAIPNWQTKLEGFEKVHLPDGLGALATEITRVSDAGFGIAVNGFFNSLLGILSPGETKSTIDQFTEAMDAVATAIQSWNSKFAEDGSEKIIFDSKGFNEIVTAMEQVPDGNLSDFIARIFGTESTVEQFSKDMGFLATGLSTFATNLTDNVTERKVSVGVRAIATLAEAASNFPSTGDSWMFFREFLGDVRELAGDALVEFVKSISGISDDDITRAMDASHAVRNIGLGLGGILNGDLSTTDTAESVKNAIEMVVDAISYTAQGDYTMVDKFIESVDKLAGAKLKEASEGIEKEGDLTGAGKSIGTSMVDGISSASFNVSDSVGKVTSDAADAVSDSSGSFASNAAVLIDSLAKALNSEENVQKIKDAMIAIAETMSATLRLRYNDFAAVGGYLAEGFAVGSNNIRAILAVRAAAAAIGQHAIQALQNAIKSASPSKESARLGGYFWQGFAYEIADGVDQVYTSSHGLGEAAVRGLKTSVRAINAMMDSGLDSEPVIRPVLDLTGIQNGTMALNGMLNVGAPIGLYGNLNAINANVNARNMTTNTDILNALNELGTALNERPVQTNNYNVGGVTYDDGTNVAMAVRDLIHAARIERRV